MAGIELTVEVEGAAELAAATRQLAAEAQDFRRVWPAVNAVLEASTRRQFDSEGAQSGGWQSLSPGYAQWKAVRFPGQPIMRRTGALFQSLTNPFDANAIFLMRPGEMVRGSRLPYAARANRIRPIFAPTEADKSEMQNAAIEVFADFGRTLGFGVEVS